MTRFCLAASAAVLLLAAPGFAQTDSGAATPAPAPASAPAPAPDPYKGMTCDDMMTKAVTEINRMPASDQRTTANAEIREARAALTTGQTAGCKSHLRAALADMQQPGAQ